MASFVELQDEEFWAGVLQEGGAALRACLQQIIDNFEVEIDLPSLELSFSLSAAISVQVNKLDNRLTKILAEIPCIDEVCDALAGAVNPEATALCDILLARKDVLLTEQASIEGQLAVLPGFGAQAQEATDNLITSGKNSAFLGDILDSLSPEDG